jgi:hypothetical protein
VSFHNLYDAAHALALAGLKLAGYRAPDGEGNRQLTLSCVEQTLALAPNDELREGKPLPPAARGWIDHDTIDEYKRHGRA